MRRLLCRRPRAVVTLSLPRADGAASVRRSLSAYHLGLAMSPGPASRKKVVEPLLLELSTADRRP